MGAPIRYALIFASISILVKLIIFSADLQYDRQINMFAMLGNLLLILLAVFFGLRGTMIRRKGQLGSFVHDLKACMKSAGVFALTMAVFSIIYYKFIDADFLDNRIAERVESAEQFDLSELDKTDFPGEITKQQFVENEREISEMIFSPLNHSTLILFVYLLIGAVYSLLITLIQRKVFTR